MAKRGFLGFLLGGVVGAGLGVVAGMLFAPRSGAESRAMAADAVNDAWDSAVDTYERSTQTVNSAVAERVAAVAPGVRVAKHRMFYVPENADGVDLSVYDYIVDAVDTVAAKLELAVRATALGVPIISAWGRGTSWIPRSW